MVRSALPLHAHPTMCLLRADSPGLPMLTGPHCSGCNTEDLAPHHHTGHSRAPRSLQTSPQKKPNLELAGGAWPSSAQTSALTLPRRREAEQKGEAPGSPAEGLLHCFDVHTAVHAPSKHSGSGHLTLSGSGINSMQCLMVPHVDPREGWQQQRCRLVTQPPGKVPGVMVALHLEGMAGRSDGTCSRTERC